MRAATRIAVLSSLIVLGGTSAETASAAPTPLTASPHAVQVAAPGTTAAYSRYDNVRKTYRLVVRDAMGTRALPIAGRRVPFDVDLGPDRAGRITAVYSRCRREPRYSSTFASVLGFASARGCRLYAAALSSGRERRLDFGGAGRSVYRPSVWRGRVAFAERSDRRADDIDLRLGDIRTRRVMKLPTGRRVSTAREFDSQEELDEPLSIDLRGTRAATVWARGDLGCPTPPSTGYSRFNLEVSRPGSTARWLTGCNIESEPAIVGSVWMSNGRLLTARIAELQYGKRPSTFMLLRAPNDIAAQTPGPEALNTLAAGTGFVLWNRSLGPLGSYLTELEVG